MLPKTLERAWVPGFETVIAVALTEKTERRIYTQGGRGFERLAAHRGLAHDAIGPNRPIAESCTRFKGLSAFLSQSRYPLLRNPLWRKAGAVIT
jgi:hypothetical protein